VKTPEQQDFSHEEIIPTLDVIPRNILIEEISKLREKPDFAIGILLSGDRMSCCDEGVIMQEKENLIGVATIAPNGEEQSGQPTIVGLYVSPEYRNKGYGSQILQKAIERCLERGFEDVRMDVMSSNVTKIIQKLPKEIQDKLDVHDLGNIMGNF
jgi:ribosomal protein S18 acetylase RimI-like enzyme